MQAPTATPMPPPTAGGVRELSMCSRHRAGTIMLRGTRNSSCLLARAIGYKPQRTKNHVVDSRIPSPAGWWREGQNPKQPRPKMDPPPSGRVYSAAQAHSGLSGLQPSPRKCETHQSDAWDVAGGAGAIGCAAGDCLRSRPGSRPRNVSNSMPSRASGRSRNSMPRIRRRRCSRVGAHLKPFQRLTLRGDTSSGRAS